MKWAIARLLPLLLVAMLAGCAAVPATDRPGYVHHVVLVWLKRPGNQADRQALVEASHRLRAIPGVVQVTTGPPVPSERAVVDDSFDLAVTLVFTGPEALRAYQDHPLHKRLRREVLAPRVRRILVYDYRIVKPDP